MDKQSPGDTFIKSKFTIPKGKKLTDDAVLKMSVKDLKEWLEDYHNFRLKQKQSIEK